MKKILLLLSLISFIQGLASPVVITKHIKIDQFGYLPFSKKTVVIVDPQSGYNASEFFTPGTGTNQYQVRRWNDDAVIYTGTLSAWNGGSTQLQSGDKGWWFDFSSLITEGSYYIFDVVANVGSHRFEISHIVYTEVLKQALRTFFYQRINFAKQAPYTDAKWSDAAAFEGSAQDKFARSRYAKTDASTAKNLSGGWMDAGDYNKYVTFTLNPLCNLLETYRLYPSVFTDNYNIPESGNSIADLLDEIKWELDWLKKMQDGSGTNGLLLKVGVDVYNEGSPPSTDANPRYYVPECTSSTLTGCAVFALASIVYRSLNVPAMTIYADDLLARSQLAWSRAKITTNNFTSFQTTCDDQEIKAGDADVDANTQKDMAVTAAAYLFEATGASEYKTFFGTLYAQAQPYANYWWGPYWPAVQHALLRYTTLTNADVTIKNNILSVKAAQNGTLSITDYNAATDLYRASMPDGQYHWGSNEVRANAGNHNYDFASFGVNSGQLSLYKEVAESYLHWFHGVNPMGIVMLTNMYAYGGDICQNEIYHNWFKDGSGWDNAQTSLYGPPPGYVSGGPNKQYSNNAVTPPYNQPPQKSYKDWNTTNGENSWEITEPSIYTQSAYISLLARIIGNDAAVLNTEFMHFTLSHEGKINSLKWEILSANDIKEFIVQTSDDGKEFRNTATVIAKTSQKKYNYDDHEFIGSRKFYRILAIDKFGGLSYSGILSASGNNRVSLAIYPTPAKNILSVSGHVSQPEDLVFIIMNAEGKKNQSIQFKAEQNFVRNINIQTLSKGVYFLTVITKTGKKTLRFLKE